MSNYNSFHEIVELGTHSAKTGYPFGLFAIWLVEHSIVDYFLCQLHGLDCHPPLCMFPTIGELVQWQSTPDGVAGRGSELPRDGDLNF
jgi:hypothetical protein